MANGVSELIDRLYTMVSDAWGLPWARKNAYSSAKRCLTFWTR
jgi:hypothetical protein